MLLKYDVNWYNEDYYKKPTENCMIGGYEDYSIEGMGQEYKTAARFISAKFKPKSIFDFGCARGLMVYYFNKFGINSQGCDFSDYAINNPILEEQIFQHDLTKRLHMDQTYDMSICFDVLEHIPVEKVDVVLKNIVKHTEKTALIFIPNADRQPGLDESHINLQTKTWWTQKLLEYGDLVSSKPYHDHQVRWFRDSDCLFILNIRK